MIIGIEIISGQALKYIEPLFLVIQLIIALLNFKKVVFPPTLNKVLTNLKRAIEVHTLKDNEYIDFVK